MPRPTTARPRRGPRRLLVVVALAIVVAVARDWAIRRNDRHATPQRDLARSAP